MVTEHAFVPRCNYEKMGRMDYGTPRPYPPYWSLSPGDARRGKEAMSKQITLSVPALVKTVKDLEDIKGKITALGGTQAQRLAAAKSEAIAGLTKIPTLSVKASDKVSDAESAIEAWKASLAQMVDEAATAILRDKKDSTDKDLSALREAFAAKRETAEAMRTMLVGIGADGAEAVVIPTLKGTGKVGGSKSTASGSQAFWTQKKGSEKAYQVDSQNKYSSLAWYHGPKIGAEADANKGKGSSKDALTRRLADLGVTPEAGKAWSATDPETGFSMGMDVNEAPTPEAAE